MPLVCYVSELEKSVSLDAERFLRLLGVSGKLSGFYFAVYMLEQVWENPEYILLITKRLYRQTAQHFNTTTSCVERNLRTLVQTCWRQPDHSLLDQIAGCPLLQPPTNTQFIDMLAFYLRRSALSVSPCFAAAVCFLSASLPRFPLCECASAIKGLMADAG